MKCRRLRRLNADSNFAVGERVLGFTLTKLNYVSAAAETLLAGIETANIGNSSIIVILVNNVNRNDMQKAGFLPPLCLRQLARFLSACADDASVFCHDFHFAKAALPSALSKYERIAGSRHRANASIASAGAWYSVRSIISVDPPKKVFTDCCQAVRCDYYGSLKSKSQEVDDCALRIHK